MSRNNTGNPIGSKAFPDFEDNVKNLDEAVNSDETTFRDRRGNTRLTLAGMSSAAGDAALAIQAAERAEAAADSVEQNAEQIAQDAAQQAVDNVVIAVDGAVDRAENAADRAETARDAAFVNADVYPDVATGRAAVANGEQFQVVEGDEIVRYRRDSASAQTEVARYPSASAPVYGFVAASSADGLAVDTVAKTVTISGRVFFGRKSLNLSPPVVLNYVSPGSNLIISASVENGEGALTSVNLPNSVPANHVILGVLVPSSGTILGAANYTRDGVPNTGSEPEPFEETTLLTRTATLYGSASGVSVNSTDKTIWFDSSRVIVDGGISVLLPVQTVDYSAYTSPGFRYLILDLDTLEVSLVSSGGNVPVSKTKAILGAFHTTTLQAIGFPSGYTVDGVVDRGPGFRGSQLGNLYADVNIDVDTPSITVSTGRLVTSSGDSYIIATPRTVVIDRQQPQWPFAADLLTFDISLIPPQMAIIPADDLTHKHVVVAKYDPDRMELIGLPGSYTVNGSPATTLPSGMNRIPALGWDLPDVYSAPAMPGYTASDPIPSSTITSSMINSWFDGLVTDFPDYVTRTFLGNEATGLPIYEYRFKPDMDTTGDPVRVMIQGGIHPEQMSFIFPYHVMRMVCEEWEDSPALEALRWGVEFSVIPALSPWGIDNKSRNNSNGVNLNRNYPMEWRSGGDEHGSAPLSELETQYSFAIMRSFAPHVFLDCHSFGTNAEGEFLWFPPQSSREAKWCASAMINRMARKWKAETPDLVPASKLARTNQSLVTGGAVIAADSLGAIGATFEVGTRIVGEVDGAHYSGLTVKYAVEAVVNYLMIVLRRNA